MLPRLTAEDSLLAAQRVAVGSGSLKPHDARAIADSWARHLQKRMKAARPTREDLAAIGIGVRVKERVQ